MANLPSLSEAANARPYLGRGCLVATVQEERSVVYFLTGRSEASRRRNLRIEGESLIIADAESSSHDPLRHYRAVVTEAEWVVAGNGDHVDEVSSAIISGAGPLEAMSNVLAEPDPPIYTPRIWVAARRGKPQTPLNLGHVSRRVDGGTTRSLWSVDYLSEDVAVLLTTYSGTTSQVTVTDGPMYVSCAADGPKDLLEIVWNLLDPNLRVGAVLIRPDSNDLTSVIGPIITN